jgi:hypothetical protein
MTLSGSAGNPIVAQSNGTGHAVVAQAFGSAGAGVYATSASSYAIEGVSTTGTAAIYGTQSNGGNAISGLNSSNGNAGYFLSAAGPGITSSGNTYGVYASGTGATAVGVAGLGNNAYGVYGSDGGTGIGVYGTSVSGLAAKFAGTVQFSGTNTTGSTATTFGSNCPAVTCTAPYTWIKLMSSDGSTVYMPVFK